MDRGLGERQGSSESLDEVLAPIDEHLGDASISGYLRLRVRFHPITSYQPDVLLGGQEDETEDDARPGPSLGERLQVGIAAALVGRKEGKATAGSRRIGAGPMPPPAPRYGILVVTVKQLVAAREKVKRPGLEVSFEGQLRRCRSPASWDGGASSWGTVFSFTTHAPAGLAQLCSKQVQVRLYSLTQNAFMEPNHCSFLAMRHPGEVQGQADIAIKEAVMDGQLINSYNMWLSQLQHNTMAGKVHLQLNWYPVD